MTTTTGYSKEFSSAILLWMRTDKTVREGKDYWAGGHAQIIASSPLTKQYRQLHMSETETGFWPPHHGLQTAVPEDRRIDGIADVTFQNLLAPVAGRKQTALAFADEINVFRRTILYAGLPGSARWYQTPVAGAETQLRDIFFLRRGTGVRSAALKRYVHDVMTPALLAADGVSELRTQVFMPWTARTWNTPNVAHDNPVADRYHASVQVGFASQEARDAFYETPAPQLNASLGSIASAVHAFSIEKTLVFVDEGRKLTV